MALGRSCSAWPTAAEKSASAAICRTCSQAACLCCLTTMLRRSCMANSALALRHVDCGLALLIDRSPRLLQPGVRSPSAN